MIRIQLGGTNDPLERILTNLIEDWDALEQWAVRNNYMDERLSVCREEKEKLLARISMLREKAKAGC